MEIHYQGGLYLPALDLWLDPRQSQPVAVVTHAHADHARRHQRAFVTEPTRLLMQQRRLCGPCMVSLPFKQPQPFAGGCLTLYPAGHVLGSAQVLIEHGGQRLLYSGDLKLRRSLTAEAAVTPAADTLVVESTFGRPHYRFPPSEEVISQIEQFCRQTLAARETPVLCAYSLGKAQELLAALGPSGLPLSVHPSIDAICAVYRRCGVALPDYGVLGGSDDSGRVLIAPLQTRRAASLARLTHPRFAVVSGWALDRGAIYRYRVDAAFPLSDHADYPELLQYVKHVGPRRVYTLHGFAHDLARALRSDGYDAYALAEPDQLQLF